MGVILPNLIRNGAAQLYLLADMQGLFTTLAGGAVSTFIGLWFGCVILTLNSHWARLKAWSCASILLFELGLTLHLTGTIPFNKNL